MNLQQIRYLHAIRASNLNISQAAERLHTSQPGISRQVRSLEDELGVEIFERAGKQLARITSVGERIFEHVDRILNGVASIRAEAQEEKLPDRGVLSVATTHTQARYVLPAIINDFKTQFPHVQVHLHQGSPAQIADMLKGARVDIGIATESMELFDDFVMMPCYHWNRCVVAPEGHPLTREPLISLDQIVDYPLLTYVFGFTGRSPLDRAFAEAGLTPRVVFSATDADVIKTYVKLGLGIGIIARVAFDPAIDGGLRRIDASHLFERGVIKLGVRRGFFLKRFHYAFIERFAPHLGESVVRQALGAMHAAQRKWLFIDETLPVM
ncbi:MAG: HTH-type transcriptional regulator CysB [Proteobacteria bacterium]|nr:MAG: HTH-type transcriptional regulator CysB [Pseudomonadota bacterium]